MPPPPGLTLSRLPTATLGLPLQCALSRPRLFLPARHARAVASRASSSGDSSFGSRMEDSVKRTLAVNPVVIYSKSWCSYSLEVKALFKRIGVQPHVIELDHLGAQGPQLQKVLERLTGQSTVPNVFIGGKHVGGCTDNMSSSETDDSSDDGEFFFKMVETGAKLAQSYVDLYMDKAPPRFMFSQQSGMGWLMETINTPGECHRMLRMNEVIFHDLHDVLVERYGLKPSKHMNTYEMLAIFLFTCGGCESNRRGQNKFKHSGETISRKFHEVLDCVVAMAEHFLRPTDPNFRNVHKRIRNDKRAYPHFKNCIGALDGTHIRVSLSPEEQVRYIGKTGIATQNVLAVCDFDMRFTYVAAGQPGSLHDTSVLYHALEADVDVFPHPPQGKYYVVDAGYPNRPGYLAPYKGERYHLPEWHRGMEPNTPKEKFNHIHSSVRNVIERSFGVLKMKWQILYKMPGYSMITQKKIVAATMVLHNFIREHASVDVDFANFDRDPTYMPTIPERYNKYAVSQHASDGSTSEASFVTMDTFRDSMATSIALAWN